MNNIITQKDWHFFNNIVWPEMWLWMRENGETRVEADAKDGAWKDYCDGISADGKIPEWLFHNPAHN